MNSKPVPSLFSYQAYFFDLDGTLLNTTPDIAIAINIVRERENLEPLEESFIEAGVGHGATVLLKHCFPDLFDKYLARLRNQFSSAYLDHVCVHTQPYTHAIEGLKALRDQGKKVVLITNKPTLFAEPLLTSLGWKSYFDLLIYGDSFEERKPSPLPLQRAMKSIDVQPSSVLFIGDTEVDVQAAQAASVDVAIVHRGRVAQQIKEGVYDSGVYCIDLQEFTDH